MVITPQQLDEKGRTLSFADDILVRMETRSPIPCIANLITSLPGVIFQKPWVSPTKATVKWFSLNNHIVSIDMPVVKLYGSVTKINLMIHLKVKLIIASALKDKRRYGVSIK